MQKLFTDPPGWPFSEAGFVSRDSDFNGVGFTVLRCDTCCALVAEGDRRGHYEWHRALDGDTTEEADRG